MNSHSFVMHKVVNVLQWIVIFVLFAFMISISVEGKIGILTSYILYLLIFLFGIYVTLIVITRRDVILKFVKTLRPSLVTVIKFYDYETIGGVVLLVVLIYFIVGYFVQGYSLQVMSLAFLIGIAIALLNVKNSFGKYITFQYRFLSFITLSMRDLIGYVFTVFYLAAGIGISVDVFMITGISFLLMYPLFIVITLFLVYVRNRVNVKAITRSCKKLRDPKVYETLDEIKKRIGLQIKNVQFLSCKDHLMDSFSFSYNDVNYVVLPTYFVESLNSHELETVLLHELIHLVLDTNIVLSEKKLKLELKLLSLAAFFAILAWPISLVIVGIYYGGADAILLLFSKFINSYLFWMNVVFFEGFIVILLILIGSSPELATIKFREARAYYLTSLFSPRLQSLLSAIIQVHITYDKRDPYKKLLMKYYEHITPKEVYVLLKKHLIFSLRDILLGKHENFPLRIKLVAIKLGDVIKNGTIKIILKKKLSRVDYIHLGVGDYDKVSDLIRALELKELTFLENIKNNFDSAVTLFMVLANLARKDIISIDF